MYAIEVFLLCYFGYVSLYSFILSIGGIFYRTVIPPGSAIKRKMAVLIPAYKEDGVITEVAYDALKQEYPPRSYDVVVIADSLKQSTLDRLRALPIIVVEVRFEKSTKVKALNRAMEAIGDNYDCAVILDADNLMKRNFLSKINDLFDAGYMAIQGKRDPKNENNSMALLDGLSETINNFIYRQGTVGLGMSASLNGSGMAFDYATYKNILSKMDSVGGFDRELELKLLERNIKVYFAKDAIVFDEKVASTEVFENQRKRWISSQFFYLKKYFRKGMISLTHGNFSFFNSAILRNIQLPRLLNLGLLTLFTTVAVTFSHFLKLGPKIWIIFWSMSILSLLFAVPSKFYSVKSLRSVLLVPKIFIKMLVLMFKLKGANKAFIHTPHGHRIDHIEAHTADKV